MAIIFQGKNVISPFSKIVSFTYPPTEGFMFFPVDDENPDGWGKPFKVRKPEAQWADPDVPEYEELPYGTSGGPDRIKHMWWGDITDEKAQEKLEQAREVLNEALLTGDANDIAAAQEAVASASEQQEEGGKWNWVKQPGDQLFGNIDWIGPYFEGEDGERDGETDKRRERISYYGPPSRYFRSEEDDFHYGEDETHEEIYYQGRYLAVAPGPVLGACFTTEKIPVLDHLGHPVLDAEGEPTFTSENWILAICKDELHDVVFKKSWPASTVRKGDMDSATRASFKELKSDDNPAGWESLFVFEQIDKAYAPETPWFFNESGTEAVASRRFEDSFNNGQSDVKEDGFYLLKCFAEDLSSVLIAKDTQVEEDGKWGKKVQFDVECIKDHPDVWTDSGYIAPDGIVYPHQWQEEIIQMNAYLDGSLVMARDYAGDELLTATLTITKIKSQYQKFVVGADPVGMSDTSDPPQNISNHLDQGGPSYEYPDGASSPADHYEWQGFGEDGYMVLNWTHPDDGEQQFTLDRWLSGTESQWNTDWETEAPAGSEPWYVMQMNHRFINFLDLRRKTVLFMEYEHQFFPYQDGFQNDTVVGPERKMYMRQVLELNNLEGSEDPEGNQYILREEFEEDVVEFWQSVARPMGWGSYEYMFQWRTTEATFETYTTESWTAAFSKENTGEAIKVEWDQVWDVTAAQACPVIIPRMNDFWWTGGDYRSHIDSYEWGEDPEDDGKYWWTRFSYTGINTDSTWWDYRENELRQWLSLDDIMNTRRHNHREFGIGRYVSIDDDLNETEYYFVSIKTEMYDREDEPQNLLVKGLDLENAEGALEKVLTFGTEYYPIGVY